MSILTLGAGVLFLKRSSWGHVLLAALFALVVFTNAVPAIISGTFTFQGTLIIAACGWGAWSHWSSWLQLRRRPQQASAPVSIVILLDQPSALDVQGFQAVLKRAWDIDATTASDNSELDAEPGTAPASHFIFGEPPELLLFSDMTLWRMNIVPMPYWEKPAEVADECPELRMAHAIRSHNAWLSFDCVGDTEISRAKVYEKIGKVIAECVTEHCLGILIPEEGAFIPNSDDLIGQLKSPLPLQSLQHSSIAPVVNIDSDDAALIKATETARDRWPEFKTAFAEKSEEQVFSIKAPITVDDNTEFIWVNVETISDGMVSGTLGNEPVDLGDLKLGSTVTVPEEDVNDWAYSKGEELIGLFSANVFSPNNEEGSDE